jgi:hypothetical protein
MVAKVYLFHYGIILFIIKDSLLILEVCYLYNHFLTTNGTTKDLQGNMSVAQKPKPSKKLLKKIKIKL